MKVQVPAETPTRPLTRHSRSSFSSRWMAI